MPTQRLVVVAGPSGSGKSTVARAAAALADAAFVEADDYHSDAARAAMAAGRGLTDAERAPWIARVGAAVRAAPSPRVVLACSALNPSVRRGLTQAAGCAPVFVMLDVPRAELARRLVAREGHFAGPDLLNSQLSALDAAGAETLDASQPVAALAKAIAARFG